MRKLVSRISQGPLEPTEFKGLPQVEASEETLLASEAIATGVYSPLEGFLGRNDYDSILKEMSLENGEPWSIPILFSPQEELPRDVAGGEQLILTQKSRPKVLLEVEERFPIYKEELLVRVLGTTEGKHPGVKWIRDHWGDRAYAGKVTLLENVDWGPLEEFRLDPAQARRMFAEKGWRTVVGFQTTNPPHRGYEHIHRTVLEVLDGLLIHPVIDPVRLKYSPLSIMRGYRTLIENYYRKERVVLGALRVKMLFAGPRDALNHAIIRRNFGCTHIIIGRKHADTSGFYGDYDAWKIFDHIDRKKLGIEPLFFKEVFFCTRCSTYVTESICPHGDDVKLQISGTSVRGKLKNGLDPQEYMMRPEVVEVVKEHVVS